ncbi:MAG: polysaccharide biosynthesis/export family protein [Deltaproteobacteria bacterium]|nr:polysaccharide biosynthesis/export family protein [Deltaproteobacteria bacterium]
MMRNRTFLLAGMLLAALGVGAAVADEAPPKAAAAAPDRAPYRIGLGDSLEVNVWKNPDVSRRVSVRPDGRFTLPLVGEIQAEGQTPEGLTKTIAEKLKEYLTDPVVTVSLETINYAPANRLKTPAGERPGEVASARPEYRVGVEDLLDINVWRNPDLSRQVWVRPDGRVSLPLVGEFVAEGLTTGELAFQLQGRLAAYFADPVVTVGLVEINSYTVYLMGMVRTPGAQKLRSPRTFLQVLTMAGGFQEFADSGNVSVVRWEGGVQKRLNVDAKKIISKGTEADFVVQPGDVIIVP